MAIQASDCSTSPMINADLVNRPIRRTAGGWIWNPSATTASQADPDGADLATTVNISNTSSSTVAFLLKCDVRRGTARSELLSGDNELQSSI
jgi:microcystin degradation protein MlrC